MRRSAIAAVIAVFLVAGCGGSSHSHSPQLFRTVAATKVSPGSESLPKPAQFAPRSLDFSSAKHGWLSVYRNADALKGHVLLETHDGGLSWVPATSWPESTSVVAQNVDRLCRKKAIDIASAVSFWSSSDGYAVCGSEPGAGSQDKWLYETSDGGKTWRERASDKQLPQYGYVGLLRFFDRDHGLMLTARGGIYATTNGGLSWWQSFYNPSEGPIYWSWPSRRDGYLAAWGNGVYVTHDLGRIWRRVWPALRPIGPISYSSPNDAIGAVSPSGPGGLDGAAILSSSDGGRSWKPWGRLHISGVVWTWGRIHTGGVVWQLVRLSPRSVVALVGSPSGVGALSLFRSDDNGRNWRKLTTLKAGKYVDASSVALAFSGRDGFLLTPIAGRLFTTHDSGASWQFVAAHPSFQSVLALGGKRVLAITSGQTSNLYSSENGGRTWQRVPITVRGVAVEGWEVAASDARHIWVADGYDLLLRTTDGAATWSAYRFAGRFQGGQEARGLRFISPSTGFASLGFASPGFTNTGNLLANVDQPTLMTRDGGRTWTPLPSGQTLPG